MNFEYIRTRRRCRHRAPSMSTKYIGIFSFRFLFRFNSNFKTLSAHIRASAETTEAQHVYRRNDEL